MNGKGVVTTLDSILKWITRLAALNLLWIGYSLIGLLVGGVFPATVAALGLSRKWINGENEVKSWMTFKQIYRQEFKVANLIGWILTLVGLVLYLNYRLIAASEGEIMIIIPFAFYLLLFFYSLIVIWVFPLLAHYQAHWFQHIKNAIIIGLTKLHYTFYCGLLIFTVAYYSLGYPGLIPFFSISVISVGMMWICMRIFWQLDEKMSE
ncbi:YesL family protein [Aquibacillus albus]|uniref:Membrane protein YesL n=1 Tax=Aquibacillus albus TaxID=1168171 RepID=A0ABS2MY00_9BACI|nr:YesL family protein [Aquibacillus albus]MBM7570683.1 putative membrane protein YesL [Aquibacillus albus]